MPWCPNCKTEYPDDATACLICHARLIDQEPDVETVQNQRGPANWRIVAEALGVSLIAQLVGTLAFVVPVVITRSPDHLANIASAGIGYKVAAWVLWLVVSALVCYSYGRKATRKLKIGYVFLGMLILQAWGIILDLLISHRNTGLQLGLSVLWTLFVAVVWTMAALYGAYRTREQVSGQQGT